MAKEMKAIFRKTHTQQFMAKEGISRMMMKYLKCLHEILNWLGTCNCMNSSNGIVLRHASEQIIKEVRCRKMLAAFPYFYVRHS